MITSTGDPLLQSNFCCVSLTWFKFKLTRTLCSVSFGFSVTWLLVYSFTLRVKTVQKFTVIIVITEWQN